MWILHACGWAGALHSALRVAVTQQHSACICCNGDAQPRLRLLPAPPQAPFPCLVTLQAQRRRYCGPCAHPAGGLARGAAGRGSNLQLRYSLPLHTRQRCSGCRRLRGASSLVSLQQGGLRCIELSSAAGKARSGDTPHQKGWLHDVLPTRTRPSPACSPRLAGRRRVRAVSGQPRVAARAQGAQQG